MSKKTRRSDKPVEENFVSVGWRDKLVRITGITPIVLVILSVVLWFMGNLILRIVDSPVQAIHEATDAQTKIISTEHKALSNEHREMIATQQRIADSLEVQTYLMTKTDKERQAFDLEKPEALRRRSH